MNKQELTELVKKNMAADAKIAKKVVVIGYAFDFVGQDGDPASVWNKQTYDANEVRKADFYKKLSFLPTRKLSIAPDENGNLKWEALKEQLSEAVNATKIVVIWDGPEEVANAAKEAAEAAAKEAAEAAAKATKK